VIVLDTSAILAFVDARERDHARVTTALDGDLGPYVIPAAILSEVGYLIEHRLGQHVLDLFLSDLESGAFTIDCGDGDVRRIRELVARFSDLPLGLADAAVVASAERHGNRVLTLDRRDFDVVSGTVPLTLLP
jgi:predicted nucleic acid-binding protein